MSKARQIADLLADLDNVATSGNYNDLVGQPTANTAFSNDAGYITSAAVPTAVSELTNDSAYITVAAVPTAVSELSNDSGFQTSSQVSTTVSTAVAAIVDTAPAALDTLNEIAASLGDDADFAGSMTSSLALKATDADLTALAARVTTEEGNVDTAQASLTALTGRVSTEEANVDALQIALTALQAQYRTTQEHTATAGQTVFTIGSLSAEPTDVECFMNGIRLLSNDYSGAYSSGTYTLTLTEACVVSDVIELVAWKL